MLQLLCRNGFAQGPDVFSADVGQLAETRRRKQPTRLDAASFDARRTASRLSLGGTQDFGGPAFFGVSLRCW
jgi:hypothetical protein